MATIGRSFDELDKKIKQFNSDIKTAQGEVRSLDKSLKLNPGNVDAVRKKYASLSTQLQLNTQKLATLRQKQGDLNRELANGSISQQAYEREIARLNKQINATEREVEELTGALRRQNEEIRNAKFDNMIGGLDKAEQKTQKLSKAALVLVGALAAVVTSAIKVGDELDDNATKYDTTAEALQIQQNRFAKLTEDENTYVQALSKIGAMQTSISAGRGAKYLNYLKQLGLSQDDLAHKTNAEIYDTIYEALRNVTDATDRAIIAQGLFGDAGLNVATVAGTAAEVIDGLDNTLIQNGIITSEQAAAAGNAADMFDSLKYQAQAASAELLVSLMPALQTLFNILQQTIIPVLTNLAQWFTNLGSGGQKLLLLALTVVIVLPKLIAIVKGLLSFIKLVTAATYGQTAATTALTTASTPWLGIITAISAALMLVVTLINMFIGKANTAVETSNELMASLGATEQQLNDMGYNLDYSAEQTYNTNTKRTVDVNVQVDAKGDGTEVDEENAEKIAGYIYDNISIDLINQCLGAVAR